MQTTLSKSVTFTGTGLHQGRPAVLRVCPAPAGHGIVFFRTDLPTEQRRIPALWDRVEVTPLNTRIINTHGASVSTIEHLMAAFAGLGIHNARVEIDGPEVPILDGSSRDFVRGLLEAGLARQHAPLRAIKLLRPVSVTRGDASATLLPDDRLSIDFAIDFDDPAIGRQEKTLDLANGTFLRELCDSRTFCRLSDVEAMRDRGLALGGTYENAVVVDGDRVLTPGGLRHGDEAVRHKMLDALGDLYTAGAPILGRYVGHRAGHALTNALLRALFDQPLAFTRVTVDADTAAALPGTHVKPADLAAVA